MTEVFVTQSLPESRRGSEISLELVFLSKSPRSWNIVEARLVVSDC